MALNPEGTMIASKEARNLLEIAKSNNSSSDQYVIEAASSQNSPRANFMASPFEIYDQLNEIITLAELK